MVMTAKMSSRSGIHSQNCNGPHLDSKDTKEAIDCSLIFFLHDQDEYLREVEEPEMEQVPDWLADLDDQSSITGGAAGDFGECGLSTNRGHR